MGCGEGIGCREDFQEMENGLLATNPTLFRGLRLWQISARFNCRLRANESIWLWRGMPSSILPGESSFASFVQQVHSSAPQRLVSTTRGWMSPQ